MKHSMVKLDLWERLKERLEHETNRSEGSMTVPQQQLIHFESFFQSQENKTGIKNTPSKVQLLRPEPVLITFQDDADE